MTREPDENPEDVVLVHGPTEDGGGLGIVRKRGDRVEAGELRGVTEGQPLTGELVRLHARTAPGVFDVEVLYDARGPAKSTDRGGAPSDKGHAGPARVTSDRYRDGWERIFRKPRDLPN